MGKIVPLKRKSTEQSWYGAVLDEDGREIPITEAMIQRALDELGARKPAASPGKTERQHHKG